jgi:general secretion pathway protein B
MSFILDALRKSERERQRQTAPSIDNAAYRPPRKTQQRWILAIIAVLGVNALLVGALLLRRDGQVPESRNVQSATVPPATPAPDRRPAQLAAQREDVRPLADEVAAPDAVVAAATARPQARAARPATAQKPAAVATLSPPPGAPAQTSADATLPSMEQLVLDGRLEMTPLRLDMHVFSDQPSQRFVFVNMNKYRQGDTLKEGPRVEAITAEGVVLSYQGNRFLLTR